MAVLAPAGQAEESGSEAHGSLRGLTLAALGVVYGDIGTSPLYTMREAFGHAGGLHLSEPAVLGVLSLVFWSLILIVTLKYVVLILRADNRGEGGVLALGTLASRAVPHAGALPADPRPDHRRAGPVLRRRPDHAGDLGPLGGRGAGDRGAGARALRRADRRPRAVRPVS